MTLVEVLVTLVLISVGLLGVAALQLTTLKNNQESYVRSQAAMLAADILDRMRSNQTGFNAGNYDMANDATGFDQAGTASTVAAADIAAWQASINRLLPGSDGDAAGRIVRNGRCSRRGRRSERCAPPALATDVPAPSSRAVSVSSS
jgi:type IV pilus assembly protein PilV